VGLVFVLPVFLAGCATRGEQEPIWLGQVVPLSGPDRLVGEHARQGVSLAVKEAHERGWSVAGQLPAVRHADSHGEGSTVRGQTVRLLAVNRVAALIAGPDATAAEEMVRAARPYGSNDLVTTTRPLGATVMVPGVLPRGVSGEFWALGVRPGWRGEVLARHALAALKAKRAVVLLDDRDALAGELAEAFGKEWSRKGGAEVMVWRVGRDGELGELIGRVRSERADVVLLAGPLSAVARWDSQLRNTGLKGPVFYGGADEGVAPIERSGLPGETYLATVYTREGLSEQGKVFARQYEKDFGEAPDYPAAGAYDAALLALETLPEAAKAHVRLREQLSRRESFESVTGPVRWVEDQARRRVFVVRVGEKGAQIVQTVEPEK
jgi:branched-chain amino acid transport system substrate-binding protein